MVSTVNRMGNSKVCGFLILFALIVLVSIFSVGSAVADDTSESEAKLSEEINATNNETAYRPFVDLEILDAFNNQTWVKVGVDLVDISNITVSGSKEERRALLKQRDELLKAVVKEVVATLAQDEFESLGESSSWFVGKITKKGFDKLVNDSRVSAIYISKPVYAASYDNETSYVNVSLPENKTESELITNVSKPLSKFKEIKKDSLLWIVILLFLFFSVVISYLLKKKEKDGKKR